MKLLLFTIILSFALFSSCEDESEGNNILTYEFTIQNNSGSNIDIDFFKPTKELFTSVSLANSESKLVDEGFIDFTGPSFHLTTNGIDSAVITFFDGKKLIQTYNENGYNDTIHNILNMDHYSSTKIGEDYFHLIFTITNEDYLRAN